MKGKFCQSRPMVLKFAGSVRKRMAARRSLMRSTFSFFAVGVRFDHRSALVSAGWEVWRFWSVAVGLIGQKDGDRVVTSGFGVKSRCLPS